MGICIFPKALKGTPKKTSFPPATGINYGMDFDRVDDRDDGEFSCPSFAGYAGIDDAHAAAFADFGILPEKNRFNTPLVKAAVQETETLPFVTVSTAQRKEILSCLSAALAEMAELYALLHGLAAEIMRSHAPKASPCR